MSSTTLPKVFQDILPPILSEVPPGNFCTRYSENISECFLENSPNDIVKLFLPEAYPGIACGNPSVFSFKSSSEIFIKSCYGNSSRKSFCNSWGSFWKIPLRILPEVPPGKSSRSFSLEFFLKIILHFRRSMP